MEILIKRHRRNADANMLLLTRPQSTPQVYLPPDVPYKINKSDKEDLDESLFQPRVFLQSYSWPARVLFGVKIILFIASHIIIFKSIVN